MKQKAITAVMWSAAEIFLRQGLQFFVSIILARLLTPEDFGLVAMLSLFISIASIFVDGGFNSALIQRQNVTLRDESTVFYFNLLVGFAAAVSLVAIAPWIGDFFGQVALQHKVYSLELLLPDAPWIGLIIELPVLQSLTYLMALNLFITSIGSIHNVLLTKALEFKVLMKIGVIATLLSGVVAVLLAWKGFGVWSLAIQTLISTFLTVILLWVMHPWRPSWEFSFNSLRSLFRFGGFMFLSGMLDTIYTRAYSLIIGKLFSARDLGFYSRAESLQQLPVTILTSVFNRVAFPVFSSMANDKDNLKIGMRKVLRIIMFFNIPVMFGLFAVSEPLVITLIGEKWRSCVQILQVLSLGGIFWPLHVINLNALMAQGYSNLFFRIEIIKKMIGISAIVLTSFYGILAIAWGQVAVSFLCFLVNAYYTGVHLKYSAWQQTRDFLPCLSAGILMTLLIWPMLTYVHVQPMFLLVAMVMSGAVIYFVVSHLLRIAAYTELRHFVTKRERLV